MSSVEGNFPEIALADTSLFIAQEQGRSIPAVTPRQIVVSIITIGELRLGVLAADNLFVRTQRLKTLTAAQKLEPLPIDDLVASAWAALRLELRDEGLRMPLNDSWIAATAIAHDLPVATRDSDYNKINGLTVIQI